MFASIRCYFVHKAPVNELARRVDDGFAPLIGRQPGFVSYEFMDCGGGEMITVSVFREGAGAQASRELARRWSDENLADYDFTITESLHGEILLRRAPDDPRVPAPPGLPAGFAAIRRHRVAPGSVPEVMRRAEGLVAQIEQLEGFVSYDAFDAGGGDIVSISRFHDRETAARSDELAAKFVKEALATFDVRRTDWIGGGLVVVSRRGDGVRTGSHAG